MNPITHRPSWLLVATTALAPIIWGSTYVVTTELLPPDRPITAAVLRTVPAGLLLLLLSAGRPPAVGEWPRLVLLSILNIGLFQALLFVSAYRLPGGLAAVVGSLQPLMMMGLVWAVDRQPPKTVAIGAGLVGIPGMAALLLSPHSATDPLGIAAAAAGAASMAAGTYLSRRRPGDPPLLPFTGWQLLLGGVMLAPVAWAVDPPLPALTTPQLLAYAYLSLFGALIAYLFWFRGITRLPSVAVSSLGLLSPVTAALIGWALLGERLSGLSLAGFVAVLGSVLLVQISAASGANAPRKAAIASTSASPMAPSASAPMIRSAGDQRTRQRASGRSSKGRSS
jgi:probable blue pigment (indigoidine) exporter